MISNFAVAPLVDTPSTVSKPILRLSRSSSVLTRWDRERPRRSRRNETRVSPGWSLALQNRMSTIDVQVIAALAIIHHGRLRRVGAVTLDETPRGVAETDPRADAPPISHVVNEFEA